MMILQYSIIQKSDSVVSVTLNAYNKLDPHYYLIIEQTVFHSAAPPTHQKISMITSPILSMYTKINAHVHTRYKVSDLIINYE